MAFADILKAGFKSIAENAVDNFCAGVVNYTQNEIDEFMNEYIVPSMNTINMLKSELTLLTTENKSVTYIGYIEHARLCSYILTQNKDGINEYTSMYEYTEEEGRDIIILSDMWQRTMSIYEIITKEPAVNTILDLAWVLEFIKIFDPEEVCESFRIIYLESTYRIFSKRKSKKLIIKAAETFINVYLDVMYIVFDKIKQAPSDIFTAIITLFNDESNEQDE